MQGEWFYRTAGEPEEHGPFELSRLRRLAQKGLLGEGTEVREGEFGPWIPPKDVAGLFPEPLADYGIPVPIESDSAETSLFGEVLGHQESTIPPDGMQQSPPANLVVSFPANWLQFVEKRVAALEAENRRWRWIAFILAALAIAGWARSLPG